MRNKQDMEKRKAWNIRFGRSLMALRAERGISRRRLAELLGVKYHRLNHWEHGHCQPRFHHLMALAEILGITCHELLTAGERLEQSLRSQDSPESSKGGAP